MLISHAGPRERVVVVTGVASDSQPPISHSTVLNLTKAALSAGIDLRFEASDGPLNNVQRLIQDDSASLAIVPSDLIDYLRDSTDSYARDHVETLRVISALESKLVHLFASRSVSTLQDLNGKHIAVGIEGDRNWLTATNILRRVGIRPARLSPLSVRSSIHAVLQGAADAMIYVGVAPAEVFTVFDNWQPGSRYHSLLKETHFLPITDAALLRNYGAGVLSRSDYGWQTGDVATIAVAELLITQDQFEDDRGRQHCRSIDRLADGIRRSNPHRFSVVVTPGMASYAGDYARDYFVNYATAMRRWIADDCSGLLTAELEEFDVNEYSMTNSDNLKRDTITPVIESDSEATGTVDAAVVRALQKCLAKGECE